MSRLERSDLDGPKAFPFGDRVQILGLADEYWSLITEFEAREEHVFEAALPALRLKRTLPRPMFLRIAIWKSARNRRHYEANTDDDVKRAVDTAFASCENAENAIRALDALRGVALRTATLLLHWMMPTTLVALDFRVVYALRIEPPKSWENYRFYDGVARIVREHANRQSVDLRTLDRALWAWSKKASK